MAVNPIVIVGVGNALMGDEGVGIHAIERLRKETWPPGVDLIDGGTPGIGLLHIIEGRDLAIIIDCADFGGRPGEVRTFDPDDLVRDERAEASLHATDLLSALELARRTGHSPKRVRIVGIQPSSIGMGTALSPPVAASLPTIPEVVRTSIQQDFSSQNRFNRAP